MSTAVLVKHWDRILSLSCELPLLPYRQHISNPTSSVCIIIVMNDLNVAIIIYIYVCIYNYIYIYICVYICIYIYYIYIYTKDNHMNNSPTSTIMQAWCTSRERGQYF